MSSCVCKILFKSEQICGCCCKMLRGSLFLGHTVVCVQSHQLSCQHDTACICCWMPCCGAIAAERQRPPLMTDMYCPQGTQQQTRPCRSSCWTMGQTDRRTNTQPLHRPCSAYYADSVNKSTWQGTQRNMYSSQLLYIKQPTVDWSERRQEFSQKVEEFPGLVEHRSSSPG